MLREFYLLKVSKSIMKVINSIRVTPLLQVTNSNLKVSHRKKTIICNLKVTH